jgi:hypothetical protein
MRRSAARVVFDEALGISDLVNDRIAISAFRNVLQTVCFVAGGDQEAVVLCTHIFVLGERQLNSLVAAALPPALADEVEDALLVPDGHLFRDHVDPLVHLADQSLVSGLTVETLVHRPSSRSSCCPDNNASFSPVFARQRWVSRT